MATTFKSGPRDPVTGRSSARISPDNVVRSDGYTDRERAEISITPEDPRRQNQRVTPKGALSFQDFLSATGRSDKDPYGSSRGVIASGLSKLGTLDYRNNLSSGIISALNQQAYDKYLNPQRDGQMRSFRPGDLAFIDGRTQRAVRAPSTAEGLMRFMPTARMLQGIFNPSVQFEPIGQGPATRGSRRPPSALEPTSAPQPGEVQTSGFTLASTLPREDNGIFNLPFSLENLRKIPETGIGGFIEQGKGGFQIGPGELTPSFDLKDKKFGLNFKIPIAQQDPQAFARDQALANQNRTQLEYPEGVERRSLYEGLASPATGLRLSDIVGPTRNTDLSDLSDSASFGNPYATTVGPDGKLITGAFVPKRIEIAPDGKLIEVPVGFDQGGEVPAGEGLFSKEELARQDEIAAAELQPDGSLPGVDTMRFATPEEVDIGAYNFQKDLEDKLLYHMKERDKVSPFEFSGITANRKIFHQRQIESLQEQIEDFRGQRGAAVANYRDYIAAGGRPLYVNTDREPYFRGFPSDLINFRATNP